MDLVADIFGNGELMVEFRPNVRAKGLELQKVVSVAQGPPSGFVEHNKGSPVQVIDGLRTGPLAIDTRACLTFIHHKEIENHQRIGGHQHPYKSTLNLVPFRPWSPEPSNRAVSADAWGLAFGRLLDQVSCGTTFLQLSGLVCVS